MRDNYTEAAVRRQANRIALLLQNEEMLPEQILAAVENETNEELIDIIHADILENEILVSGLKEHIKNASERKSRLEKRIESLRNCIVFFLKRTDREKIVRPLYTASLRVTPSKLVVDDESEIPSEYFKVADPVIDTKKLKSAIEDDGLVINGVYVTEPGVGLTIRNK